MNQAEFGGKGFRKEHLGNVLGAGYGGAKVAYSCAKALGEEVPKRLGTVFKVIDTLRDLWIVLDCYLAGPKATSLSEGNPDSVGRALQAADLSVDLRTTLDKLYVAYLRLEAGLAAWIQFIPEEWLNYDISTDADGLALSTWLGQFLTVIGDQPVEDGVVTEDERTQLLMASRPSNVTLQMVNQFIDRWNRSLKYWGQGITDAADVPIGLSRDW